MPSRSSYSGRSPLLWYHALIAGFTMFAGLTLLTIGIVLRIVDPLLNLKLSFTSDSSFNEYFTVAYLAMFSGVVLVLISVVGACAVVKEHNTKHVMLCGYTLLCMATIVSLVFLAVVWTNLARGSITQFGLEDRLHKAWQNTVVMDRENACEIQDDYQCFGFRDGDCTLCSNASSTRQVCTNNPLDCPICGSISKDLNVTEGCFNAIVDKLKNVHTPAGISCAITAAVLVLDMVFVYAL